MAARASPAPPEQAESVIKGSQLKRVIFERTPGYKYKCKICNHHPVLDKEDAKAHQDEHDEEKQYKSLPKAPYTRFDCTEYGFERGTAPWGFTTKMGTRTTERLAYICQKCSTAVSSPKDVKRHAKMGHDAQGNPITKGALSKLKKTKKR